MNYLKILIFYILIFGFVHNISSDKPYNIHLNKDINADKLNYLKTDVVENGMIKFLISLIMNFGSNAN